MVNETATDKYFVFIFLFDFNLILILKKFSQLNAQLMIMVTVSNLILPSSQHSTPFSFKSCILPLNAELHQMNESWELPGYLANILRIFNSESHAWERKNHMISVITYNLINILLVNNLHII